MKKIPFFILGFAILASCSKEESIPAQESPEMGQKTQYAHDVTKEKIDNLNNPIVYKVQIFADYSVKEAELSKDKVFTNQYIESVCFHCSTWHHNSVFYQWPSFANIMLPHVNDPDWEDLNQDAGGKYIYTFIRGTSNGSMPVTNFWVQIGKNNYANACLETNTTYGPIPADLNKGAGGDYIYACQTRSDTGHKLQGLGVIIGNSSAIQPPSGWQKINVDLNKGAGGAYIYFIVKWVY